MSAPMQKSAPPEEMASFRPSRSMMAPATGGNAVATAPIEKAPVMKPCVASVRGSPPLMSSANDAISSTPLM